MIAGEPHEGFEELDAASKSGKADLARVVEDVKYATFSGQRRIYLFDESHRLSKAALDILLKPMEDCVPGTQEKKLVCLFSTTEPEKMRSTVFSRCAPAFVIRPVGPEAIAERLAYVCEQELLEYDSDALVTLAESCDSHIRDALKLLEGVSMLGGVSAASVSKYLRLDANQMAVALLQALGTDLPGAVERVLEISREVSPSVAYRRIAEASMVAYRHHLGVGKIPTRWGSEDVKRVAEMGSALLMISSRFAAPPHRPSDHTLVLDVGSVFHALKGQPVFSVPSDTSITVAAVPATASPSPTPSPVSTPTPEKSAPSAPSALPSAGNGTEPSVARTTGGVWIDPRAIGNGPGREAAQSGEISDSLSLSPETFRELVQNHLRRLMRGGRTG